MRRVDFPRCPRPRPPLCRPQHRPSPNRQAQEVSTQSINQSPDQPINQSINQLVNQTINQSIKQSVEQAINRSINQSINEDAKSCLLNFFCYSYRLHDSEETFPPRRRGELQRSLPYLHVHGRVSDLQNQPEGLPVGKVISGQRSALLGRTRSPIHPHYAVTKFLLVSITVQPRMLFRFVISKTTAVSSLP